ncbi:MAG: hypothetical protein LAT84_07180 [Balneolia bacterium]|nr:hypothetical protein [Balneolia bacterium]
MIRPFDNIVTPADKPAVSTQKSAGSTKDPVSGNSLFRNYYENLKNKGEKSDSASKQETDTDTPRDEQKVVSLIPETESAESSDSDLAVVYSGYNSLASDVGTVEPDKVISGSAKINTALGAEDSEIRGTTTVLSSDLQSDNRLAVDQQLKQPLKDSGFKSSTVTVNQTAPSQPLLTSLGQGQAQPEGAVSTSILQQAISGVQKSAYEPLPAEQLTEKNNAGKLGHVVSSAASSAPELRSDSSVFLNVVSKTEEATAKPAASLLKEQKSSVLVQQQELSKTTAKGSKTELEPEKVKASDAGLFTMKPSAGRAHLANFQTPSLSPGFQAKGDAVLKQQQLVAYGENGIKSDTEQPTIAAYPEAEILQGQIKSNPQQITKLTSETKRDRLNLSNTFERNRGEAPKNMLSTGSSSEMHYREWQQAVAGEVYSDPEADSMFGYASETQEIVFNELDSAEQKVSNVTSPSNYAFGSVTMRKDLVTGLSRIVLSTPTSPKSPEAWTKQNLTLEDGSKIHVASREQDGLIQLRIGSVSPELNKLLQLHQQDIRAHLEKECSLKVELQFDNEQDQSGFAFFEEDSRQSMSRRNQINQNTASIQADEKQTTSRQSIRHFGYNKMEWTA